MNIKNEGLIATGGTINAEQISVGSHARSIKIMKQAPPSDQGTDNNDPEKIEGFPKSNHQNPQSGGKQMDAINSTEFSKDLRMKGKKSFIL
ncbi:MAG: hypothetical protein GY757_05800 [bacterium]|nr:hypothetical protein [bacterium]